MTPYRRPWSCSWRGWNLTVARQWEPPIQFWTAWHDNDTAYAVIDVGSRGGDPQVSIISPHFRAPDGWRSWLVERFEL